MQDKITVNYPVDEAAIRNIYRKLLPDRGRGSGESRASTYTEDGDYSRRALDMRARFSAPRGQSANRNTHPI